MDTTAAEIIAAPYRVPFAAQVASPDLAEAIFTGTLDPRQDPNWPQSGADSPEEYAYWTDRACGVACVKMCVEALGGTARPLVAWARLGVERGGYLTELRPDGSLAERGWLHSALAGLMQAEGLHAEPRALSLPEFPRLLRTGCLLIASVSYEIGTTQPVTKRGGHLVVVSGAVLLNGVLDAVMVYNPSGRTRELRESARIPAARFESSYTGRVIVCQPQ